MRDDGSMEQHRWGRFLQAPLSPGPGGVEMAEFFQNYGFFLLVLIAMAICHLGHGRHGGHRGSGEGSEAGSGREGGTGDTGHRH